MSESFPRAMILIGFNLEHVSEMFASDLKSTNQLPFRSPTAMSSLHEIISKDSSLVHIAPSLLYIIMQ